jgi:hypothetical protein
VFSGVQAEYAITVNPNGSVTVSHIGGAAIDGTDTLWNIETLRFLDGDVPVPTN